MFGLGTTELIIIFAIILVIFGVGKLPQVGEGLGKMISGIKRGVREDDEEKDTPEPPKRVEVVEIESHPEEENR